MNRHPISSTSTNDDAKVRLVNYQGTKVDHRLKGEGGSADPSDPPKATGLATLYLQAPTVDYVVLYYKVGMFPTIMNVNESLHIFPSVGLSFRMRLYNARATPCSCRYTI